MCAQRRLNSAYASVQFDRLFRIFIVHIKKLLIIDYPKCSYSEISDQTVQNAADLNLHWAYMSERALHTFSDMVKLLNFTF